MNGYPWCTNITALLKGQRKKEQERGIFYFCFLFYNCILYSPSWIFFNDGIQGFCMTSNYCFYAGTIGLGSIRKKFFLFLIKYINMNKYCCFAPPNHEPLSQLQYALKVTQQYRCYYCIDLCKTITTD